MTGICPIGGGGDAELSSLDALAAELCEKGLEALILRGGLLTSADPQETNVAAKTMNHRMTQTVACRRGTDGRLWWYWVWSGPTRDSAPDFEPLCPAQQIGLAATRIARVLSLRPTAATPYESSGPFSTTTSTSLLCLGAPARSAMGRGASSRRCGCW
jgi:hypothetical protein